LVCLVYPDYEAFVLAPDGSFANFDAALPFLAATTVFEAKTGREWAIRTPRAWITMQTATFIGDQFQFWWQKQVAEKCDLKYSIYFEQELAFKGYNRRWPLMAPHYEWHP